MSNLVAAKAENAENRLMAVQPCELRAIGLRRNRV